MRAIRCGAWGGPENLELADIPAPELGPGQVRIKVHAAGANFADLVLLRGEYQEKPDLPFTPGLEAAGEIVELGADVGGHKVGDRVMAVLSTGGFAEQAVSDAGDIYPMPEGMDFVTAAGFPVAYGTSHVALTHRGRLQPGEYLLVFGASGGVGLTAVECGKAMGATVIACASSPDKLAIAEQHGADHLIDYSAEDVRVKVREFTGGHGADVIYDPVGGDLARAALRAVAWEGRILIVGFASGEIPQYPANYLLVKNASAVGVYWGGERKRNPGLIRDSFATLAAWYRAGKLAPHVSQTLPLAEARQALEALAARRATGKIVLTMDA